MGQDFFFPEEGGGHPEGKIQKWVQNAQFWSFYLSAGGGFGKLVEPSTGNVSVPLSCHHWVYVIPPANLDDLQDRITPEVDVIRQDWQVIWWKVFFFNGTMLESSRVFPNHLLMHVGMELPDILFLFVVLISFQFSQLAQVVFDLTLLFRSCAVMHSKWFDETAIERCRRSYSKSSCQNILYMLEN